ncbi:MAG: 3-deoxy-7-phosphoheptulonate synthase, partial [Lachnospiraceae bacterium]|nr:3-deoxy-7-phosphoheptulonate synthase [Lachnospiraceae bacterium]
DVYQRHPLTHCILRGTLNKHGQSIPNYHYEDLILLYDLYQQFDLQNPACIVDANHNNSGKQWQEQPRIVKEILHSKRHSAEINGLVKGVMVESYIEDGSQPIDGGCYGKSITDPCLGWDKTEHLILEIADLL